MKQEVKIGQTDYTVLILIRDTAGAPKTGLTNASAGLDVCYTRVETDNDVVLTAGAPVALATPALTDPHLDWGFLEVDATNAPGLYRLDLPDGVFATGAWSAVVSLIGTGIDPCQIEFILVPELPYNGVDVYSIRGTAQTANDNGADINDILTDTGTTLDGKADQLVAACITNAAGADIAADIIALKAVADTIQADTDLLDDVSGGLADIHTDVAAVKADTAAILVDTGTTLDTLIQDIPTTAEFEARTLPAADYTIVADLGVVQTADHTAAIADIPTVAEFNARTIASADYTIVADLGTVQTADHTASIAAIKAITDLLPSGIKKNTALNNFEFYMVLAADHISPATGKTIVCQRSIDGGAFANCNTVNATEVSAGIYKLNLAASDVNGDVITFKFTEATCDTRMITVKTST